MDPHTSPGEVIHHVVAGTSKVVLDILGPTVEFLTSPAAAHGDFCVMRGMIPPGVAVPLHSHDATEVFFVLSGSKQVLTLGSGPAEWVDVRAGDYVHVPRGTRHAHRNVSDEPLVELVITTARLGNWFEEVGTPATGAPRPPAAGDLERFLAASGRYGYWLGSPEDNAAVGLRMLSRPAADGGEPTPPAWPPPPPRHRRMVTAGSAAEGASSPRRGALRRRPGSRRSSGRGQELAACLADEPAFGASRLSQHTPAVTVYGVSTSAGVRLRRRSSSTYRRELIILCDRVGQGSRAQMPEGSRIRWQTGGRRLAVRLAGRPG